MSILIKNGIVVDSEKFSQMDVYVVDDKVVELGENLNHLCDTVIDATGKFVIPGLIDMHCHLRDPGYEGKETIETGTRAALAGGFSAVACMPNTNPAIDNATIVHYINSKAKIANNAKVYVIGSITKRLQGQELSEMGKMKKEGIVAVSDDGFDIEDSALIRSGMEYARSHDILTISHSEDKSLASGGSANEGLNATIAGLKGMSRMAEEVGIARQLIIAEHTKAKLHIAHVSTKGSVQLVREAKARGVAVTCEACPHHIAVSDDEILNYNTSAKINPPLRERSDLKAIVDGIIDGTIDVIATDHAPHTAGEKGKEFELAPFGSVGLETALAVAYTYLVDCGHIELSQLVKLMSYTPAKLLNVEGGEIVEGGVADITIFDPEQEWVVDSSKFESKGKNSVFEGWKLVGKVTDIIVNGEVKTI